MASGGSTGRQEAPDSQGVQWPGPEWQRGSSAFHPETRRSMSELREPTWVRLGCSGGRYFKGGEDAWMLSFTMPLAGEEEEEEEEEEDAIDWTLR
ncbi:hypothetical protein ColTof3_09653 [Colletotrichum tofieldiae]|nr:hypothetical protein ColTof3_09653 [Colletotrichum tofieldiae]